MSITLNLGIKNCCHAACETLKGIFTVPERVAAAFRSVHLQAPNNAPFNPASQPLVTHPQDPLASLDEALKEVENHFCATHGFTSLTLRELNAFKGYIKEPLVFCDDIARTDGTLYSNPKFIRLKERAFDMKDAFTRAKGSARLNLQVYLLVLESENKTDRRSEIRIDNPDPTPVMKEYLQKYQVPDLTKFDQLRIQIPHSRIADLTHVVTQLTQKQEELWNQN